jgi:hypothetical protein
VEDADIADDTLRALVGALRAAPDAEPSTLMTDLADEARNLLAALVVDGRHPEDATALIHQFTQHLTRLRSLRQAREILRGIAEVQEASGVDTPVEERQRLLHEKSGVVYQIAGGVAQSLEHGTPESARSRDA